MVNNQPPYKQKAVSKVSPSIVSLTSYYPDNKELTRSWKSNGTIFYCEAVDDENGPFVSYILTSAYLIREKGLSLLPKVDVYLATDKLYEGEIMACDKEINAAVIKIKSNHSLPTATLTPFTDSISVSPFEVSEGHAPSTQSPYQTKLFPGDEVFVVFRQFQSSPALVCSAIYSVDCIGFGFDRGPFLKINCEEPIDGAPVINCVGDVIGVSFLVPDASAFLPVNVFFKWWKQVMTYGEIRRPWMGITIANLYTADVGHLEAIVHDCDASDGIIIEDVMGRSPADFANMRSMDVICQCDGRPMRSLLEFTEFLWDKSGEVIEAKGVRNGCHFVWKVEIQAIKSGILPGSLAENVVTLKKSAEIVENKEKDKKLKKKDKELTGLQAKTRKRKGKTRTNADAVSDSVAALDLDERKKSRWGLSKCSET